MPEETSAREPGWYDNGTRPDSVQYWDGRKWRLKWKAKDDIREDGPEGTRYHVPQAAYLGGLSDFHEGRRGAMLFTPLGITVSGDPRIFIRMGVIADIKISSETVARSRAGFVLAFGVFGLGAKSTQDRTTIVVHTTAGDAAYFQLFGVDEPRMRGLLAPVLREAGLELGREAEPEMQAKTPAAVSVADEIRKLAGLRDEGLLTQDEFDGQKAKLLSQ